MHDVDSVLVSVSRYVEIAQSETWFTLLAETYDEHGGDWPVIREVLPQRVTDSGLQPAAAEVFVSIMDTMSDPAGLLWWVHEHSHDLSGYYAQLLNHVEPEHDGTEWAAEDQPTAERLAEWKAEKPLQYHWFPGEDGAEGSWRVWHAVADRFVTEAEWHELADEPHEQAADQAQEQADAPALSAEVEEEVVGTVMAPAITNAIEAMAADSEFSEEDVLDVLNRVQSRLSTAI